MSSPYFIIAEKIEAMPGGYVVHVRWPYGPTPSGCGPVVCPTWKDVLDLLTKSQAGIGP